MHQSLPSITIVIKLNKRLELLITYIKSLRHNSNVINSLILKTRLDLIERYKLRNNYYHRKFPLILNDLSIIKSSKIYFQLLKNQHYQSVQISKQLIHIQSSTHIEQYHQQLEQSINILNQLKNHINEYETKLNELKEDLIEKTKQIHFYSINLLQIQYEQKLIQSNIVQLHENIRFEKQLYNEIKQQLSFTSNGCKFIFDDEEKLSLEKQSKQCVYIDQLYQKQRSLIKQETILNNDLENIKDVNQNQLKHFQTECTHLSTQINQIEFNIEQITKNSLVLQSKLYIYRTIFDRNKTSLHVPTTTNIEQINQQSDPLLNKPIEKKILPQQLHMNKFQGAKKSKNKLFNT